MIHTRDRRDEIIARKHTDAARRKWTAMRHRKDGRTARDRITYEGVTIAEEWKEFAGFLSWYLEQPGNQDFWDLDKDILVPGNKVYGPQTCALVPSWLNAALTNRPRGALPAGVQYRSRNRVMASIRKDGKTIKLGTYQDPMEAHRAWQIAKADSLDALARRYQDEQLSCYRRDVYLAIVNRSTRLRLDAINGVESRAY